MATLTQEIFLHYMLWLHSVFSADINTYTLRLSRVELSSYIPLGTVNGTLMKCSLVCITDSQCRVFQLSDGICRVFGSKKTFYKPDQRLPAVYLMNNRFKDRKTFGDQCLNTSECVYQYGLCLRGACTCQLGYSFNFSTGECVSRCTEYGSAFTMYNDTTVENCNKFTLAISPESCMEKCRNERKFACINCQFKSTTRFCHKCSLPWSGVKEENRRVGTSSGWVFFYRHCKN